MSRLWAVIVAGALLAGACGHDSDAGGVDAPTTAAAASADAPAPAPDALPMADVGPSLVGPTAVTVVPGETLTIDHLVANPGVGTRTIAVTARNATDGLIVESEPSSLRLGPGAAAPVTTTVTVPESVPESVPGAAGFEIVAVFADDITARAGIGMVVQAARTAGLRPVLAHDRAVTSTNERVISYVVGNDTDPDDGLDLTSLRIVAGPRNAAGATASPDGTISYEPFADRTGTDIVIYELCDPTGLCDTAVLTVTVEG